MNGSAARESAPSRVTAHAIRQSCPLLRSLLQPQPPLVPGVGRPQPGVSPLRDSPGAVLARLRYCNRCTALLDELTGIARARGASDQGLGGQSAGARSKADGSPVTAADEAAEAAICEGLAAAGAGPAGDFRGTGASEKPQRRAQASGYFLVDPLDGTREFIAGRDEYTVNIALIRDGAPILGIIAAPALGLTLARHRRPRRRAHRLRPTARAARRMPIHDPAASRARARRRW